MGRFKGAAAVLGVAMLVTATAAGAVPTAEEERAAAESVRKLDIMLMVSSLRCRTTADNFQADYADFTAAHLPELNAANGTLERELTFRFGSATARRELDRLSTRMANEFGQGHPWLTCHDLKQATRQLATDHRPGALLTAASEMLYRRLDYARIDLDARY